ncbi:MAG TPA: aspartate 1-decarboxylase [Candidatus Goldiibacteriota bacterium]|nr:aspartate 1-decarboxylase [Candidatus Goldiibacteriota bacterium]
MLVEMLKSKIHRAVVTDKNLEYEGSITIDCSLMAAAGIAENEKVHVLNLNNGARFETYVIKGKKGSGEICVNGAAARLAEEGDRVIIVSYGLIEAGEAGIHRPKIVKVGSLNRILKKG